MLILSFCFFISENRIYQFLQTGARPRGSKYFFQTSKLTSIPYPEVLGAIKP